MGNDEEKIDKAVDAALEAGRGVAADVGEAIREEGAQGETPDAPEDGTQGDAGPSEKRSMTRRGALVGVPAFLAGLLLWKPRVAWGADYPSKWLNDGHNLSWDIPIVFSAVGDRSGTVSEVMYTDKEAVITTPWCEWTMWENNFLGVALRLKVRCDFTTELYHHYSGILELAGESYVDVRGQGWQSTPGNDTVYELRYRVDNGDFDVMGNQPDTYDTDTNTTNPNSEAWGDGHYAVPFQTYGSPSAHSWEGWIRREATLHLYEWELAGGYWNFWRKGIGYPQPSDSYRISTITRNSVVDKCPVKVTTGFVGMKNDDIKIDPGLAWAGRIVEIRPKMAQGKRLDVIAGGYSNGTRLCVWDNYECTNQNWEICTNLDNDRFSTQSLSPVHSGGLWLDQDGGAPQKTPANAQIYQGNGTRAQAFWIYDSDAEVQFLFADCSGFPLDLSKGVVESDDINDKLVQFHSSGYCASEWGNTNHQWTLKDAFFKQRKDAEFGAYDPFALVLPEDAAAPVSGHEIGTTSPSTYCRPHPYNSTDPTKLTYMYSWALLDENDKGEWVNDLPDIMGQTFHGTIGWLRREQPTNNFVGAVVGYRIKALLLHLEGGSLSGGIEYQLRPQNGEWPETWCKDGETAGSDAAYYHVDMFRCRLTGDIADKCDVVYWANYVGQGSYAGSGWPSGSDWPSRTHAKNGEAVGIAGRDFQALRIQIEPKAINGMAFSEGGGQSSFTPSDEQVGKKLACFVRCRSNGPWSLWYRGTVGAVSGRPIKLDGVELKLFVDGEQFVPSGLRIIKFQHGETIVVKDTWTAEAKAFQDRDKTCSGWEGWYTDPECTQEWDGSLVSSKDLDKEIALYSRNKVVVGYSPTTHARNVAAGRDTYRDEAMSVAGSVEDVPETFEGYVNDYVEAKLPDFTKLWYPDAGSKRVLTCAKELYTRDYSTGARPEVTVEPGRHQVTRTLTYYVDWDDSPYDGFIGR